ncbi:MAG: beta-ketoacyl-ACP synthase II [Chitinophagales bacterium]|nr:beta-ketoacyl-ACP synthase II [Chitinophagales bacterium]
MKRVVITGLGAITPIGNNLRDYWAALLNGKSGAGPITKFHASRFKTQFACEVKDFNPLIAIDSSELKKYDLYTQYALVAAGEAIQQAQIQFDALNKKRIGVIWGTSNGGISTTEQEYSDYKLGGGIPRFNPYFIPKRINNIAAGAISIKYDLHGINFTTASACASSNTAIINAFNYIRWGKADMIITGGSEASITESSIGGFNAARAISTSNENHTTASKPFDIHRNGFVLGEGAGALVFESLEHAIQRGAPILAEIVGSGLFAEAYHLTGTHPKGEGAAAGMALALEEAGIQASEIDYVNAHATSTQAGDLSELFAMKTIFGNSPKLNISATKSITGHLIGAAGAIEAIACIQSIRHDIIPPTINTSTLEHEFTNYFDFTLGHAVQKKVIYAMNNTFGFGGHIASSIFKKYIP